MRMILAATLVSLGLAAPAAAFTAVNGLTVQPLADGRFNVPWRGQSGDAAFWCAAADYAQRRLGLPSASRVWRISEPPRRQGQGIVFSISPEGAASRSGLISFNTDGSKPDASLSIAAALVHCERYDFFGDD